MAPNPRRQDERLQALYDKLPTINCQGLCYDSCGPIDCSVRERTRMEREAGHPLGVDGLTCNMLVEGRCSVYGLRPLICRAWGVVESMPCPYGCKPEPAPMPDHECALLIVEAMEIGGGVTHADEELWRLLHALRADDPENFDEIMRSAFQAVVERPTLAGRGDDKTGVLSNRPGRATPTATRPPSDT